MPSTRSRRFSSTAAVIAVCLLVVSYFIVIRSSRAHTSPIDFDATDHLPITPAGRLLIDSLTGLPAVAPLTMNFVRTPDGNGPDGKGRYLIAANSGFGLTFDAKSKPNQTLWV